MRWLALLMLGGCALEPGHGFATMGDAELRAEYTPGARLGADGRVLIAGGAWIELDTMKLEVLEIALDGAQQGSGGGIFDPANPPANYSLCHAGHCHHVDGRLVPYEEIQAELDGGSGGSFVPLVSMPVEAELDLLVPTVTPLERFEPSAELPRGTIARARVTLGRFALSGRLSDPALGAGPIPISVDGRVDGPVVVSGLLREIERGKDPLVDVLVTLGPDGTFFDDVDFAALLSAGEIRVTDLAAAEPLLQAIFAMPCEIVLD